MRESEDSRQTRRFADEQILKIVSSPADYRPEVVEIAKDEFRQRGGAEGLKKRAAQRQAAEEERAKTTQRDLEILERATALLNAGQTQHQVETTDYLSLTAAEERRSYAPTTNVRSLPLVVAPYEARD